MDLLDYYLLEMNSTFVLPFAGDTLQYHIPYCGLSVSSLSISEAYGCIRDAGRTSFISLHGFETGLSDYPIVTYFR